MGLNQLSTVDGNVRREAEAKIRELKADNLVSKLFSEK